ncbi:acyl transferase [Flagellimonas aequoris]|uniref:Acyl transferase n=1 Tax=Flagellimonas aequoris TaxID=2306997 RepID=A0A418N722_9FLAO|nr:acyl transferase [Allomuricauda aequoris]RIV70669.1 acyl transferase [Allomuricauda aequoris]TXK02106.1 acyl transferase [Allomuricauda aequoris]
MHPIATDRIFSIANSDEFEAMAWELFRFQYHHNTIYKTFCDLLDKPPSQVGPFLDIPFLPIEFFKTHKVISSSEAPQAIFESSGTTQSSTSKHLVPDLSLYEESFLKGFSLFYGPVEEYCILALLPAYLERKGSSLVYMVNEMVARSHHPDSGFYLYDLEALHQKLLELEKRGTKTLLIGVSFALLDLAEQFPMKLDNTIIMETGGMKGRRKELIREELHGILTNAFGVPSIHSEYGMTELLSQAYSKGNGIFETPPWMKIVTRDTEDPLSLQAMGKTGGINIIDLANVYSCSFIATQDLGKTYSDGSFEVLGRFDSSDIRGCNLMVL